MDRRSQTNETEIQVMVRKELRNPGWTQKTSAFRTELTRLENSWTLRRRFLPILVMCQGGILDLAFESKVAPLRMRAEFQGAIVAVALEQFRRSNSRWLQDLSELTPQLLKTLPLDPRRGAKFQCVNCSVSARNCSFHPALCLFPLRLSVEG
jgi:hypothetical protein